MNHKKQVPEGYAELVQKELMGIAPNLLDGCPKSYYCGFKINKFDNRIMGVGGNKGYSISDNGRFPLEEGSRVAMFRGFCDTKKDAKYFVDQILYSDMDFQNMYAELKAKKELTDKKKVVSLLIKNI